MKRRTFIKKAGLGLAGIFAAVALGGATPDFNTKNTVMNVPEPIETQVTQGSFYKHATLSSMSTEKVGTRLVCLFDASGSIDSEEYKIQMESMADAIESDDFRDAIFLQSGPGSIAICFADFGSTAAMRIPWIDIRKGEEHKLKALANELRNLPRREQGSTNHTAAFNVAAQALENCPWEAEKNIVDIMTDGKANTDESYLPQARNNLITGQDATINALVTLTSDASDLDKWAGRNLITQPGFYKADGQYLEPGFTKIVADQRGAYDPYGYGYGYGYGGGEQTKKYEHAMRWAFQRKLVLEVAGIKLDDLREKMGRSPAPYAFLEAQPARKTPTPRTP